MGIGSGIRVIYNAWKPHPLRKNHGRQIDYNITSVIMPSCIIGVNLGIIVNIMTPEPIVLGFLILALIYLVISTGLKWWSVRKRERKNMSVLAIKVEESSVSEHANEIEIEPVRR